MILHPSDPLFPALDWLLTIRAQWINAACHFDLAVATAERAAMVAELTDECRRHLRSWNIEHLAALAPGQAPLLLSLNSSMLYIGTALGAAVGGVTAARLDLAHLSWAGVPFVAAALVILRLGPHRRQPGATLPREETRT